MPTKFFTPSERKLVSRRNFKRGSKRCPSVFNCSSDMSGATANTRGGTWKKAHPHDPRDADVLIYFAGQCYGDVSGKPTPLMLAFKLRFLLEHPESGFLETVEVSKLGNVYQASARISRQEFLDEFLSLIQSNLPRFHSGDPPELEKP
jgi:hypothetical protein